MNTVFIAHILFPRHESLKHHTAIAVCRNMEQRKWWDTQSLETLRMKRLHTLLIHDQTHAPYYQDQSARTCISHGNVHNLENLSRQPFLCNIEIRAGQEILKAGNSTGVMRFNTRCSRDEPLIVPLGNERANQSAASGRL